MTKLLTVGNTQLGKANEEVKQAFGGEQFPLSVVVSNKMTITISLPEAHIRLAPMESDLVRFDSYDRLQRAATSLEQVAMLNSASELVTLELVSKGQGQADDSGADETAGDEGQGLGQQDDQQETTEPEQAGDEGEKAEGVVTVIQDDADSFIVELDGIQFSPNRNSVRKDGTLTSGGVKAFEEAKAAAENEQGAV